MNIGNNLKTVSDSGRGMNDIDLFPITEEMLKFIDDESFNLEMYRTNEFKNIVNQTNKISQRMYYLQVNKYSVNYFYQVFFHYK